MTPCFNEEANVYDVYSAIKDIFDGELSSYNYEHVFIDNSSSDRTVEKLREIAQKDKRVKVIVNVRNFGQNRSPYYGVLQCEGDAVIPLAADLQEPVSLIPEFVKKWEEGYGIVVGIKEKSAENRLMFLVRKIFYNLIKSISDAEHIANFTGYGLYDKKFVETLRTLDDPYPYFRGLVAELGSARAEIKYTQEKRKKGKTSNNFFSLYDVAMLGFVNHSKLPLRLASFIGFFVSIISLIIAAIYLVDKLMHWNDFNAGTAPLVIGLFFFSSIQLIFIGVMGEYISAIYTKVRNHPLVVEKERINF